MECIPHKLVLVFQAFSLDFLLYSFFGLYMIHSYRAYTFVKLNIKSLEWILEPIVR
jgi:hypothetical protein